MLKEINMPDIKPGNLPASGFGPAPGKINSPNSSPLMRRPVTRSEHSDRETSSKSSRASPCSDGWPEEEMAGSWTILAVRTENHFTAFSPAIMNLFSWGRHGEITIFWWAGEDRLYLQWAYLLIAIHLLALSLQMCEYWYTQWESETKNHISK